MFHLLFLYLLCATRRSVLNWTFVARPASIFFLSLALKAAWKSVESRLKASWKSVESAVGNSHDEERLIQLVEMRSYLYDSCSFHYKNLKKKPPSLSWMRGDHFIYVTVKQPAGLYCPYFLTTCAFYYCTSFLIILFVIFNVTMTTIIYTLALLDALLILFLC